MADEVRADDELSVSTLELFFDLVFVFTITQLTAVLSDEPTLRGLLQAVVMLGVIWWMYGGYAWLTNAVAPDRATRRLLLLGGMAAFMVLALAIPDAFGDAGLAFGIAYLVVVLIHAGLFSRASSGSVVSAVFRLAPFNIATAALVLAGGIAGGDAQYVLWALAFLCEWATPPFIGIGGFEVAVGHFVERHGLVLIVALGESVVAIGIGAGGLAVDGSLVAVAVLSVALSACLWWTYFGGDDEAAERSLRAVPAERRPWIAVVCFGYWQLLMLLGIIAAAAGIKEAVGHPGEALKLAKALMLGGGVAIYALAEVLLRTTLSIEPRALRMAAAAGALATIPVGTELSAAAQIAALVAILGGALAIEWQRGRQAPRAALRAP